MVKVYVDLIKKGLKTIDDVPVALKEQVKKILLSLESDPLITD